jgi:hypothetical protein
VPDLGGYMPISLRCGTHQFSVVMNLAYLT